MSFLNNNKVLLAIITIWLFHISALIGSGMGYTEWFASKTPLNLIIQNALLILIFPFKNRKSLLLYLTLFLIGMVIEIIGVNTGIPFGTYSYGENLGIKIFGVPLLIGCNWSLLVFITANLLNSKVIQSKHLKALIGASSMLLLDYFMEFTAPVLDFWEFIPINPPIENYIAWFITAFFMHLLYQLSNTKGNSTFSRQLYIAQLSFFLGLLLLL